MRHQYSNLNEETAPVLTKTVERDGTVVIIDQNGAPLVQFTFSSIPDDDPKIKLNANPVDAKINFQIPEQSLYWCAFGRYGSEQNAASQLVEYLDCIKEELMLMYKLQYEDEEEFALKADVSTSPLH